MPTPLQQWKRHRVDYRLPLLLSLALLAAAALFVPGRWWLLGFLGRAPAPASPPRFEYQAQADGLQIVDARLLPPSPASARPVAPEVVRPSRRPAPVVEEDAGPAGEGGFRFDPTRSYRLGEELLLPPAPTAEDSLLSSLDFLLSTQGLAGLALEDTSRAAVVRAEFARLQRRIFAGQAPAWAWEKAVERYKELMDRLLMDDPLRGPQ